MKIFDLSLLLEAAELALKDLSESRRKLTCSAISNGYLELKKREEARKKKRPCRTTTRKLIRAELHKHYARVRLSREGEWHVQAHSGAPWMLFALDDNDAQEELIFMERKRKVQACGCITPHSRAAGVIEACLAGKREAALEMDGCLL